MSGLHNTMRRLVVDGAAVAHGLYAVGDSVCTTNPTLGRGLTLALLNAIDLADVLGEARDPAATSGELHRRYQQNVEPFYRHQVSSDEVRLAALRHTVFGAPPPIPAPRQSDRVDLAELRIAAMVDPVVFRAFFRLLGMLELPETVSRDPEVVHRVRRVLAAPGELPRAPQPDRGALRTALGYLERATSSAG
jgi:flavin-dependent dehydrogenase